MCESPRRLFIYAILVQLIERLVANEKVAGLSPASRSNRVVGVKISVSKTLRQLTRLLSFLRRGMKKEEQLVKVMTVSAAAAYRSTYPAVKDTYAGIA